MDNNMKSRKPCSLEWNKLFTDFYEVEATSEIPRNEIAEIHGTTNIKSNNTTGSRASSTEKLLTHVDDDFDYLKDRAYADKSPESKKEMNLKIYLSLFWQANLPALQIKGQFMSQIKGLFMSQTKGQFISQTKDNSCLQREASFVIDTGHTKKLFFNKDVRDATDDLCDILSEWCNCFLRYYNLGLYKALHNGQLQCKLRRFMRSDSHNFRNDTK
ncbi:hypothetical protein RhiirA1_399371 [Rhizophagus irregularis]|uniref:Uncharacterized protein n=1 Tax=Rhizophagus irregularis TaxID=588596 RepID=A0A2N0RA73_9GLOM|nr:hypothetical protein RhiirA1_399371 [Rhizophagus irregularis]